jgi:hypothetical protein
MSTEATAPALEPAPTPATDPVLRHHLTGEVAKLHTQRKRLAITGVALIVLVFGYMTWLYAQVSYFSKPDNLATMAEGFVIASLPEAERATENMIKTEVPRLVKFLGDTVVREVPTKLRQELERMVLDYSRTLAMYAVKQFNEAFEALLIGAREDIDRAIKTEVDSERVVLVANAVQKQVELAVTKVKATDVGDEPLFVKLEQSHKALVNLNVRLQKLAERTDNAPHKEQLERRFISAFWRFAQQQNPEIKATK